MPRPVDTKTGEPWPEVWANRKLQEVRAEALRALQARDRSRGIPNNGQVYTTETEGEGKDKVETAVIDVALAKKRHNYGEARKLFRARWFKFCSVAQDLGAFQAAFEKPDVMALKDAQSAAADIEKSIRDADGIEASLPGFTKDDEGKRSPGRPKKEVAVEA